MKVVHVGTSSSGGAALAATDWRRGSGQVGLMPRWCFFMRAMWLARLGAAAYRPRLGPGSDDESLNSDGPGRGIFRECFETSKGICVAWELIFAGGQAHRVWHSRVLESYAAMRASLCWMLEQT